MEEKKQEIPPNKKGTCKKGFFVLRQCKKQAIAKCALSKRYICEDCAVEWEGKTVCAEELVKYLKKQGKKPDTTTPTKNRTTYRDDNYYYDTRDDYVIWYYSMRDDFYVNEGYEPFTDFDTSGFSSGSDAEFGGGEFSGGGATAYWDEEGEGDFYDS